MSFMQITEGRTSKFDELRVLADDQDAATEASALWHVLKGR
jgi:hypothetical protein